MTRLCKLSMLLAFTSNLAFAQQSKLDTLRHKFDTYRITSSSEKIYAHLDQNVYVTGETLWFKLYLVDAVTNKPAGLSKVAYLEILDPDNRPVLQTKVSVQNGFGNGSLFLPASIAAGYYTVRAYTNWMKNFDPDFYFHKSISIINTFRKLELDRAKTVSKPEVQFFPEGGNLIDGLNSKVAFRITNSAAPASNLHGFVLSQDNDTLSTFAPDKMGNGSFELTPKAGFTYHAIVADQQGNQSTIKLPLAMENGFALKVTENSSGQLSITVLANGPRDVNQPVYLFVHSRNMITKASMHYLPQGSASVVIPKMELSPGISHITLFDAELRPVCERLYFNTTVNKLNINLQASQKEYGIRRKVSLDINTTKESNIPVPANLSLSVYRLDSIQEKETGNILNYMWLESDLQHVPELPTDFLDSIDAEKKIILDNIMLTNGWRRFKWNSVINDSAPVISFIPEVRGHLIRGKITNPENAPARGVTAYLSAPGLNIQVYGSTSNVLGDIQFEMKDFSGPRRIVIQTNITKDSTSRIEILSPFSNKFITRKFPRFTLNSTLENELLSRSVAMQVQDIFYQDKGAQSRSVNIDTTAFYGKADATYYLDDYTRFPVMEEVMREYVPGVLVRKRRDGFHFINLDVINKGVFDEDPFILLDGIPLFDADRIMAFDPLKIKKLEVVTRRYYMGVMSLPGIVSYTTYAGDLGGFQLDPKSIVMDYEGLQFQREFYTPKYETNKQRDSRLPDQRNLIFWAPTVITSKDGKQHVEFYTSDLVGNYHVVVEGLTTQGMSGSGTVGFAVRPFDN